MRSSVCVCNFMLARRYEFNVLMAGTIHVHASHLFAVLTCEILFLLLKQMSLEMVPAKVGSDSRVSNEL